jgi:hypothetical protein
MKDIKVIQVIYCEKERRGEGKAPYDPIRVIPQVYTLDGELIMENDSELVFTKQDLMFFASYNVGTKDPNQIHENFDQWEKDR